jgi:enoyl-CoA hydratase/carnithine racemase
VLKMIWLGEPVSAEVLHAHGLVTAIAPSGRALEEALRIAERLAAMAPNAIAAAKELVDEAPGHSLSEQLAAESDRFIDSLFHDNGEEGLQAFLDKRAARFS